MKNENAKYTPGPWIIQTPGPGDIGAFIEAENPSFKSPGHTPLESKTRIVAKVPFGALGGRHGADARLIAAAPDLLAALVALLNAPDPVNAYEQRNSARAAIAKAK